jgi:hypothetical protein
MMFNILLVLTLQSSGNSLPVALLTSSQIQVEHIHFLEPAHKATNEYFGILFMMLFSTVEVVELTCASGD